MTESLINAGEEFRQVAKHLGEQAPPGDRELDIAPGSDNRFMFILDDEVYRLSTDGDFAIRYRPSRDGTEDVTYFRDGEMFRHISNPSQPMSN